MRRILMVAALLLCLSASAFAVDIKLGWTQPAGQQWTAVRIYERVGTTYSPVGEVAMPASEITLRNVAPGTHNYVARSVGLVVEGHTQTQESVNSNEVTGVILAAPAAPTTITITIVVQ